MTQRYRRVRGSISVALSDIRSPGGECSVEVVFAALRDGMAQPNLCLVNVDPS